MPMCCIRSPGRKIVCNMDQKEKVLVTGASGLIGSYLISRIQRDHSKDLYVTVHKSLPKFGKNVEIDLLQIESLSKKLKEIRPDIIVNLAGLVNVDICEIEPDLAMRMNQDLVTSISKYIIENNKSYFLHVSTDYVFNGNDGHYK